MTAMKTEDEREEEEVRRKRRTRIPTETLTSAAAATAKKKKKKSDTFTTEISLHFTRQKSAVLIADQPQSKLPVTQRCQEKFMNNCHGQSD